MNDELDNIVIPSTGAFQAVFAGATEAYTYRGHNFLTHVETVVEDGDVLHAICIETDQGQDISTLNKDEEAEVLCNFMIDFAEEDEV